MKTIFVLLFFVASAIAVQQKWKGVLDQNKGYIPGSILVWAESANKAKKWADIHGIAIATEWHDSIVKYDQAMLANKTTDALGHFYAVVACIGLIQPYINHFPCREFFADTHVSFGAVVRGIATGTTSMPQANNFMIEQYKIFNEACGPQN